MAAKPLNLQDQFLNAIRKSRTPVTIFLVKGVKLQGVVIWFDAFSLLLRRDRASQLVYKHSISTVMPQQVPADFQASGPAESKGGSRPPLQDLFLSAATREQGQMTIFLVNGVMLQGTIVGHDQFSLLLERAGQVQLVYKHAVSTLQSAQPLTLDKDEDEPEADPE